MPHVATFGFKYNGRILIPGEVLRDLDGVVGDTPLVTLRYLVSVSNKDVENSIQCDDCGRIFLTLGHKDTHKRQSWCMDEDGKPLEMSVLLGRVGLSRTDTKIIDNLPAAKREELLGTLPPMISTRQRT